MKHSAAHRLLAVTLVCDQLFRVHSVEPFARTHDVCPSRSLCPECSVTRDKNGSSVSGQQPPQVRVVRVWALNRCVCWMQHSDRRSHYVAQNLINLHSAELVPAHELRPRQHVATLRDQLLRPKRSHDSSARELDHANGCGISGLHEQRRDYDVGVDDDSRKDYRRSVRSRLSARVSSTASSTASASDMAAFRCALETIAATESDGARNERSSSFNSSAAWSSAARTAPGSRVGNRARICRAVRPRPTSATISLTCASERREENGTGSKDEGISKQYSEVASELHALPLVPLEVSLPRQCTESSDSLRLSAVKRDGSTEPLTLDLQGAIELYNEAVRGLPEELRFKTGPGEPLATLTPSPKLAHLVQKSRELAATGVNIEGD